MNNTENDPAVGCELERRVRVIYMIDWKIYDRQQQPPDGQYLVFCTAPNFDSEWIDIARFDNGKWHSFRSEISHDLRVRQYGEINYPNVELSSAAKKLPTEQDC